MFNNKLETEEKVSNRSFSQASDRLSSSKHSDPNHGRDQKHKSDSVDPNNTDNTKPFRPKSIGHYILGSQTYFPYTQSFSH